LLSVYRDANKAARKNAPPRYFNDAYLFETFEPSVEDASRRQEAEEQAKEVSDLVNNSIKEIFAVFQAAVHSHYEIDELEGTRIARHSTQEPLGNSMS
jgi:hypothetical protein